MHWWMGMDVIYRTWIERKAQYVLYRLLPLSLSFCFKNGERTIRPSDRQNERPAQKEPAPPKIGKKWCSKMATNRLARAYVLHTNQSDDSGALRWVLYFPSRRVRLPQHCPHCTLPNVPAAPHSGHRAPPASPPSSSEIGCFVFSKKFRYERDRQPHARRDARTNSPNNTNIRSRPAPQNSNGGRHCTRPRPSADGAHRQPLAHRRAAGRVVEEGRAEERRDAVPRLLAALAEGAADVRVAVEEVDKGVLDLRQRLGRLHIFGGVTVSRHISWAVLIALIKDRYVSESADTK